VIAVLVHLNGPPAVGKSTVAELLTAERPLALNLDIDVLRVQLGGWRQHPKSKQVARDLGFALAAHHLGTGHDVVLPQLIVRVEVIEHLEHLAVAAGATFVEIILTASPDQLSARASQRHSSLAASNGTHPQDLLDLAELADRTAFTLQELPRLQAARRSAILVDASDDPAVIAATIGRLLPTTT
jgi:predicted kinase